MRIFPILAAATLTACGSGDKVEMENASVAEVANELAKTDASEGFVNPGQWKQTVTLLEISTPNMPPQIADAIKRQAITMKMEVAAERIGECPAKQG